MIDAEIITTEQFVAWFNGMSEMDVVGVTNDEDNSVLANAVQAVHPKLSRVFVGGLLDGATVYTDTGTYLLNDELAQVAIDIDEILGEDWKVSREIRKGELFTLLSVQQLLGGSQ